jgi:2-dehydro-3-deoxyglucarate aldolase
MINSREDAELAVAAAHYPPRGRRGVGLARAQGYGVKFHEYQKWAKKNIAVVVQIEHIDAVTNIRDILDVPGVSAAIIGPYDLSASMGLAGKFQHPDVVKALKSISEAVKNSNVPFGFHVVYPDVKAAAEKFRGGYSFIALGVDFVYLEGGSRTSLRELRQKGRR